MSEKSRICLNMLVREVKDMLRNFRQRGQGYDQRCFSERSRICLKMFIREVRDVVKDAWQRLGYG